MNKYKQHPTKENICAVVVSYHPESNIEGKITELIKQVAKVVVIDNGSSSEERVALTKASLDSSFVSLILNEENIGQAKALNMGVAYAKEQGYSWVLTMDQDSLVSPEMIDNMSIVYQQCKEIAPIASICPVLASYDGISPPPKTELQLRSFSGKKIDGEYSLIKIAITSGNLIDINVFNQIGVFEEDFFIGYVDQEFSLRLFRSGYRAIQANKAVLYHNIGDTTKHSFLGKQLMVSNSSSLRTYYFYRNGVMVYKKYILSDFGWVAQDFVRGFLFNIVKITLFESDRRNKLFNAYLGLIHGLIGKMDKYG
jgi:rhamnosyltransferase